MRTVLLILSLLSGVLHAADFRIEHSTVLTSQGAYHWSQSRAAVIPGDPVRVIVTTQEIEKRGSHGYRDLFITETTDGARTWSATVRIDLPKGGVLLPVRYRADPKTRVYTTVVARCSFDGEALTYREHGSEFSVAVPRGLYEPSVCAFKDRYFLTMRAERTGYVARGTNGIDYEPIVEWKFDDGQPLGSCNTQQHWITHGNALYLIYTRRGANNDHVFRNRAPIFIARADPEKLHVIRSSEQVLLPATGVDLGGGFAPADVNANETWVISSEMAFPKGRQDEDNHVLLAKILWNTPN